MVDSGVEGLGAAEAAAGLSAAHGQVLAGECRILVLAAHWADLHSGERLMAEQRATGAGRGGERSRRLGGEGTPEVAEFAAAELGARLGTTTGAGAAWLADALDVRHRLPLLWARVGGGGVRVWQVRKVAQATRHLDVEAAGRVDQAVAGCLGMVPWARFETVLQGRIIAADPGLAEERARWWAAARFVRAGRSRDGMATVVARACAGDAAVFMATIDRLAEILAVRGDRDTVEVRRSKAIGVIAQPALALQLLWEHRGDTDPAQPAAPADAEAGPPEPDDTAEPEPAAASAGDREPDPGWASDREEPVDEPSRPDHADADGEPEPGWPPAPEEPVDKPTAEPVDLQGSANTDSVGNEHLAEPTSCSATGPSAGRPDPTSEPSAAPSPGWRPSGGLWLAESPVDPAAARPRVVLYVHLAEEALRTTQGAVRVEGDSPWTIGQLARYLAGPGCNLTVQPVIDLTTELPPVDGYEIPDRFRERIRLRRPASCFPYSPTTSRRMDLDHTQPYHPPSRGGPPGQTGIDTLGALNRTEHRIKTHGRWQVHQPTPGIYVWRSPYGAHYLVTNGGTLSLGDHDFARTVWQAAAATATATSPHQLTPTAGPAASDDREQGRARLQLVPT